jgi:hypothetical protein
MFRKDRQRRQRRVAEFQKFLKIGPEVLEEFARRDPRHEYFAGAYAFKILKGGRSGGIDERILEVFYGKRAYDQAMEFRDLAGTVIPQVRKRSLVEEGASLTYHRLDNGAVLCFLRPAAAEGYRREEETVILRHIGSPKRLHSKHVLKTHWNHFMSYCEVTSLDGDPTLLDRARVGYILLTRKRLINGVWKTRRIVTGAKYAIYFLLAVGLNGFVVALIQAYVSFKSQNP